MKLGPQQYLMIKMCFRNLGRIICSVVMWVASCVRAIFINSIFISTSPPLTQSMLLRKMKMSKQRKLHKRFLHYHPITASNFTKNTEWTLRKQHSGSIQSTRQASSERTLIAPSLHFPSPLNATYTYYRVFLLLVNQRRESTTGYKGQVDIPLFQHLQQSHTPQKHAATRKIKQNSKNSMFIVSCHKDCTHWRTFSIHTGTYLISKKHLNPWCFASSSCSTILWIAGTYRFHTAM